MFMNLAVQRMAHRLSSHMCCVTLLVICLQSMAHWNVTLAADIHLKPSCKCQNATVRLGEIAVIKSRDRDEVARLSRLRMFHLTDEQYGRTVTHHQVRDVLEENGYDSRRFRLSGATSVRLVLNVDDTSRVPPERHETRFGTRKKTNRARQQPETIRLVHALRPLRRGDVVRPVDVNLVEVPLGQLSDDVCRDVEDVVGQVVKQPISAGDPVLANEIQAPILVRRGELVTVVALAAGVRVKTEGRAVHQGSYGDLITVESLSDRKKKFSARVVDVQQVEVYARGVVVH